MKPHISICIPAYKNVNYLERLLNSISIQTYKDYEVVITDDSPDDGLELLLEKFTAIANVRYYKNKQALGTPENWNEGIRKAEGNWIKIMHDDDWFDNENSLIIFYETTLQHPGCSFFFSAFNKITSHSAESIFVNPAGRFLLWLSPLNLFKKQYIGHPSCILIRRDLDILYDKKFKWVVDFEYYIRCLRKNKNFFYIKHSLINIGVNDEQVTNYAFRNPAIEIPENHLLIEKLGFSILRNIFVYDYYWRLYRNLEIRNVEDVKKYFNEPLHPLLKQMIHFQNKIRVSILKNGLISKVFMMANYIVSLFRKI